MQFYSASYTEDIREVVRHVSSRYPEAKLYAAGWSIGANILVHYLGQVGSLDYHMLFIILKCLISKKISFKSVFSKLYEIILPKRRKKRQNKRLYLFKKSTVNIVLPFLFRVVQGKCSCLIRLILIGAFLYSGNFGFL